MSVLAWGHVIKSDFSDSGAFNHFILVHESDDVHCFGVFIFGIFFLPDCLGVAFFPAKERRVWPYGWKQEIVVSAVGLCLAKQVIYFLNVSLVESTFVSSRFFQPYYFFWVIDL